MLKKLLSICKRSPALHPESRWLAYLRAFRTAGHRVGYIDFPYHGTATEHENVYKARACGPAALCYPRDRIQPDRGAITRTSADIAKSLKL